MKKYLAFIGLCSLLTISAGVQASEVEGSMDTGVGTSNMQGTVIAPPLFSPVGGSQFCEGESQTVTISAGGSQGICYTLNGTAPACNETGTGCESGKGTWGSSTSITTSTSVKAVSCYANGTTSGVSEASYSTKTCVTDDPVTSSSGGSGGGGGSGGPPSEQVYFLTNNYQGDFVSNPVSFHKTDGETSNESLKLTDNTTNPKYIVEVPADTIVTDQATGDIFTGKLVPPRIVPKADRPEVPVGYQSARVIQLKSVDSKGDETHVDFSKPYFLTIAVNFTKKVDPNRVNVYYFNVERQQYELQGNGGVLSEDQKSITVKVDHTSLFAVLYQASGEVADKENIIIDDDEYHGVLSDLATHWSKRYVEILQKKGVVKGYADGTFKPDKDVNRAELLKIVMEAFEIEVPKLGMIDKKPFSDVPVSEWYTPYVVKAKELGIINGYPDGSFKPANMVNRVEALKIGIEATKVALGVVVEDPGFADVPHDAWYAKYIVFSEKKKMLETYFEGGKKLFKPGQNATRGEMAKITVKVLAER